MESDTDRLTLNEDKLARHSQVSRFNRLKLFFPHLAITVNKTLYVKARDIVYAVGCVCVNKVCLV